MQIIVFVIINIDWTHLWGADRIESLFRQKFYQKQCNRHLTKNYLRGYTNIRVLLV